MQILGNSKFKSVRVVEDGYIVVGQSIYENSTLGMSDEGGAIIVKYDKSGEILSIQFSVLPEGWRYGHNDKHDD